MPTESTANSVPNANANVCSVTGVRGGPRVTSKPLEEPAALAPSSPPADTVGGSPQQHPTSRNPTVRAGTKRPRAAATRMCRRGSSDAGVGADGVRAVVACAPVKPAATVAAAASVPSARTLAFAAASATGHIGFNGIPGHHGLNDDDAARTLRVRVQRLLVQFVMLPVVWVSLCCVLTAAMGIGAVESLQRALVHDTDGHSGQPDDEEARRPTKKTKRESLDAPGRRPQPRVDDEDSDDARGLVFKRKTRPDATAVALEVPRSMPLTPPGPRPRRRRVLIWDLDETLVLFASLYSGQFARTSGADLATSVALGEQMMKYLLAVLERHFFFSDLHDADIDHISCVVPHGDTASHGQNDDAAPRAELLADRYARIRAIYERHDDGGAVDFLDDPASPWFSARQALVTSIDMLSTGWIREARELLALTAQQTALGSEEIVNVLVTNTQLSPALCKCLIYGLDAHFPIEQVYSSSKLHKLRCFETIRAKFGGDGESDVEFVGIGDGAEEEQVSRALGMAFVKIRSIDDLRRLRHELQLAPPSGPSATTKEDPQPSAATTTLAATNTTRVASPPSACAAATASNE